VLVQHVKNAPPHLEELAPHLAPLRALDALVHRCMAKSPAARPGSAFELIEAIDQVAATLPPATPVRGQPSAQATMQLPAAGSGKSGWVPGLTPDGELAPVQPPAPLEVAGASWGQAPRSQPVSGIADGLEPDEPPPGMSRLVVVRPRWPIAVGVVAALAAAGIIGWKASRSASGSGSRSAAAVSDAAVVVVAPAPSDAAPRSVAADASPAHPEQALTEGERASRDDTAAVRAERRKKEIAEHLAEAEKAFRAKRPLLQQAAADAVLALDKRHPRANFLFGDALVQAKDLTNGCAYLKRARGVAAAKARMAEVGCK
jgi:hypothetical protein